MSRARIFAALSALNVLLAAPLTAQEIEQQRRAVDSLRTIALAARALITRYDDSVRAERMRSDTIVAAPLRVLSQPAFVATARAAATDAADSVSRVAGTTADRLSSVYLTVSDVGGQGSRRVVQVRVMEESGRETLGDYARVERQAMRDAMARLALMTIAGSLDLDFRRWAGGAVSWDTLPTDTWRHVRLQLLSNGEPEHRACYDGDQAACRRLLVGSDSAARGLRLSLASVAIQAGGDGAFERLLTNEGTPVARLEATAQMPLDSLVARWQSRVRYARGPSEDMGPGMAVASSFWIVLMGALSLRSSRWR